MAVRSVLGNIWCGVRGNIYCGPSQGRTERLLAQITLGPSSAAAYRRGGRVHLPKAKSRDETGRRVRFYVALGLVTAATLMLQIIDPASQKNLGRSDPTPPTPPRRKVVGKPSSRANEAHTWCGS